MMRIRTHAVAWLAAVFLLAGCGGEEGDPSEGPATAPGDFCERALARVDSFMATVEAPVGGPRHGGTVVVGGLAELVDGMNGLVSADYAAGQHQSFVNLMTLVRYDADLEPVPWLAESWEVSDDGTTLTFRLRDDVRWHDGERTDAHDVAFTFRRATDPTTGFPNTQYFNFYETGDEAVEVVDSFTVRFRMRSHVDVLDTWRNVPIMPEHLLGDVPAEELRRHPYGTVCPVGNGPFVFREHRQDASWSFEANPVFPEELGGRPYVDRYVYRIIPEEATLLTELLTGSVDVQIGTRPDQADRIREAQGVELHSYRSRQYTFIAWNTRLPELSDPRVRRALAVGVDRRRIVEASRRGFGRVANTPVPPFHWAYDDSFRDALPYDPARARRLLDEAGWTDRDDDGVRENAEGVPLSITVEFNSESQQRQDIAEIMQAQLREVGVEIEPRAAEYGALVQRVTNTENRDFEGVILSFTVDFRLDDSQLFHSRAADRPFGFAGLQRPDVDRLLDTLPVIRDREEARPLWREYQEKIVEYQPYMFVYFQERLLGVRSRVRGVEADARGDWVTIHEWWIPEDERQYAGG